MHAASCRYSQKSNAFFESLEAQQGFLLCLFLYPDECCGILSKKRERCLFPESATVMEFHEKLQKLRKQKGLTQEELAQKLFVSRTAVSKWESGRGYPNIESLKEIANFFSVTLDELLSGEELLNAAREDLHRQKKDLRIWIFGLMDVSAALLLVLPLFGETVNGQIRSVSLWHLTEIAPYMKGIYLALTGLLIVWGLLTLLFGEELREEWKTAVSLLLHGVAVLLFIAGSQPYAAALLFVLLAIKFLLLKRR